MSTVCAKCGHIRLRSDPGPQHACPKCGIVYALASRESPPAASRPVADPIPTALSRDSTATSPVRSAISQTLDAVTAINRSLSSLIASALGFEFFLGQLQLAAMFDVERTHLAATAVSELGLSTEQAVALLVTFEGLFFERSMSKPPRVDEVEMHRNYMALAREVGPTLMALDDVMVNAFVKRITDVAS